MNNPEDLVVNAERKMKSFYRWALICYFTHMTLIAISNVCSILVPFGLAALLFVPEENRDLLNITLLALSGTALILHVLDNVTRLADRNRRLRNAGQKLDAGLRRYKAEKLDVSRLLNLYDEATKLHAEEEV